MTLICTVTVISNLFFVKADVEGVKLSESEINYYVDFSKDLKARNFTLDGGKDGKKLVPKSTCVEVK